jgi:hypothetical protein
MSSDDLCILSPSSASSISKPSRASVSSSSSSSSSSNLTSYPDDRISYLLKNEKLPYDIINNDVPSAIAIRTANRPGQAAG